MNRPDHPWKQPQTNSPKARRPGTFGPDNQPIKGEIPVEKLQAAFRKSGVSKSQLARRLGWIKQVPNIHRVSEALGLERCSNGQKRKRVTYETAVRICEALGASPVEMGI